MVSYIDTDKKERSTVSSRLSRRLTSSGRAVWGGSDGRGLRRGMGGMGDENGEGRGVGYHS